MPLWLTVILLLITRIKPIGLNKHLHSIKPSLSISLRHLFRYKLSAWLVSQVTNILGVEAENLDWKFELLYVPFLLPFLVVSAVTVALFRKNLPEGSSVLSPFKNSFRRSDALPCF
jgi:lactate permease